MRFARPHAQAEDVALGARRGAWWHCVSARPPTPLILRAFAVAMRGTDLQLIAFVQWFYATEPR